MDEKSIICPNCKEDIQLSQTIIGQIEERMRGEYETCLEEREEEVQKKEKELERSLTEMDKKIKTTLEGERKKLKKDISKETEDRFRLEMIDLEEKLKERDCRVKEIEEEELKLRKKERELDEKQKKMEIELEKKVQLEREKIKADVEKRTEEKLALEMKDLEEQLKEKDAKIKLAQKEELKLRKKQRELEEKEEAMEVELQRKMDAQRKVIEESAMEKIQEQYHLKELEKEKMISDLKEQIEIMKRKAEQGSQQLQGEVLELTLEEDLSRNFPFDEIIEVKKGQRGADILQKVRTNNGYHCGTIIWETKRAKNWSGDWVPKLKDDMKEAKADVAVLCSTVLPKDVEKFSISGDVVITTTLLALPVASLLREQVMKISRQRNISDGMSGKKDLLYSFLTGPEFRQNVEGMVEAFLDMKTDLDKEKAALGRIWSKREKQMLRAITNLGSIYGSMQGIAGTSLPTIENLEIEQIAERSSNGDEPSLDEFQ